MKFSIVDDKFMSGETELTAKEAVEKDAKGFIWSLLSIDKRQIAQEVANYRDGTAQEQCAKCNWFVRDDNACVLVAGDIEPGSVSDFYLQMEGVKEADPKDDDDEDKEPVLVKKKSIIERIKETISPPKIHSDSLHFFKQADGRIRFMTKVSNQFKDRDGETFSEASHKEYVDWVDTNKAYPELWVWHTKGTKWGEVDWIDYADGFLHESGLIDKDKEHLVTNLKGRKVGVSHGFFPLEKSQGVFYKYRQFEVSVLDADWAANQWTDFSVVGESKMFNENKRKWLQEVAGMGEDDIKSYEAQTIELSETLKTLGIEYKDSEASVVELTKAVAEMSKAVTALTEKVTANEKSFNEALDGAVADAFKAKSEPVGHKASESDDNLVAAGAGKTSDSEWFDAMVFNGVKGE